MEASCKSVSPPMSGGSFDEEVSLVEFIVDLAQKNVHAAQLQFVKDLASHDCCDDQGANGLEFVISHALDARIELFTHILHEAQVTVEQVLLAAASAVIRCVFHIQRVRVHQLL